MKKNLLCLFVLICSVSLFTACSDDDPKNTGPDFTMLQDATVGTYDGGLKVSMNGVNLTPEAISQRIFVKAEGADKVELSLRDFSFLTFLTFLLLRITIAITVPPRRDPPCPSSIWTTPQPPPSAPPPPRRRWRL